MTLEQLRQQVLQLPAHDRAILAQDLIGSLETLESSEGLSQAWLDEIARRSDALHRGEMKADDWRTSLGRVRERLAEKRS
jgi:putative addiction module component (TIGR02574 family)